jgi:ribonuclease HI
MHTGSKSQQVEPARWRPPAPGWIKCNVDGAFYPQLENAGATGAVLRDHNGGLLQGKAVWREHITDAMTMEVLALKEGLLLARQRGALKVCAETDCLEVVNLWRKENQYTEVSSHFNPW